MMNFRNVPKTWGIQICVCAKKRKIEISTTESDLEVGMAAVQTKTIFPSEDQTAG